MNAIDIEAHELLCDISRDFRDDPQLRAAVITGTGDAFTAGADLKTHAPEWQTVGSINGRCVGHGVELAMACDIRIASERAQFGTFEVRRGTHQADGGIVRLVNTCGVGVALELLLTGEPISAERALTANMVARVVPHDKLMEETDAVSSGSCAAIRPPLNRPRRRCSRSSAGRCMTSFAWRRCGVTPCAVAMPQ